MCDNLFMSAILQMGPIYWFLQMWWHFGIYEFSMLAWAAVPNACMASFWCSSRITNNFRFAGLKRSFWNLCFAVAIDCGFKYFVRKTARISPKFSRVVPLVFLNVCSASPFMREWKWLILSSSVSRRWMLRLAWKNLETAQTFQYSRETWALRLWVTLETWKFD